MHVDMTNLVRQARTKKPPEFISAAEAKRNKEDLEAVRVVRDDLRDALDDQRKEAERLTLTNEALGAGVRDLQALCQQKDSALKAAESKLWSQGDDLTFARAALEKSRLREQAMDTRINDLLHAIKTLAPYALNIAQSGSSR